MQNTHLLTPGQIAAILRINEHVLGVLVSSGQMPYTSVQSNTTGSTVLRFNPNAVDDWLKQDPMFSDMNEKAYLEHLKKRFLTKYPEAMKALQELNSQFAEPRQVKGYNLTKVKNKKLGFVYYVRYIEHGKLVPTRWTTRTNNRDLATQFAIENRERLLAEYKERKKQNKITGELYTVMGNYYAADSVHLQEDFRRGRVLCNKARQTYHNFMSKKWVPYLKENDVKTMSDVDTPLLARFQDKLLSEGIKPQTINHYLSYISMVFDHLVTEGGAGNNPVDNLVKLKINEDSLKVRGCYDTGDLAGVFKKRWKNKISRLLCLLIYTTNMRNIEIERMQVKDIIKIDKYHFINIPKSKSKNSVRVVPLHDVVYRTLVEHIKQSDKKDDDFVFKENHIKHVQTSVWHNAYVEMGRLLKYDEEKLKAENITFYSGRHFWKTLMNSEELCDAEEVFMGHKVTDDVAKRYNHRDKQGKEKIIKKARQIFTILDKWLFKNA